MFGVSCQARWAPGAQRTTSRAPPPPAALTGCVHLPTTSQPLFLGLDVIFLKASGESCVTVCTRTDECVCTHTSVHGSAAALTCSFLGGRGLLCRCPPSLRTSAPNPREIPAACCSLSLLKEAVLRSRGSAAVSLLRKTPLRCSPAGRADVGARTAPVPTPRPQGGASDPCHQSDAHEHPTSPSSSLWLAAKHAV